MVNSSFNTIVDISGLSLGFLRAHAFDQIPSFIKCHTLWSLGQGPDAHKTRTTPVDAFPPTARALKQPSRCASSEYTLASTVDAGCASGAWAPAC